MSETMKQAQLPLPEIGLIAATRGMLGAGVAFLLADRLSKERRKTVGWALFLVGAISTVPLIRDVLDKRRTSEGISQPCN